MNRTHRIPAILLAALFTFAAGNSSADDTEIYVGDVLATQEGVLPNVLFVLDTSGSMSSGVSGTGMDRLDNMKAALNSILGTLNNVNVGLMRFHDPGAPILYPVTYIDKEISTVTNGGTEAVNSRVSQGTDDAEEHLADNAMDLLSEDLELVDDNGLGAAGTTTVEFTVASSTDDAAEQRWDGSMRLGDDRLRMGPHLIGVRFNGVSIPQGATITSAYLQFTTKNEKKGSMDVTIYAEDSDDADTFSGTDNDISDRTPVATTLSWHISKNEYKKSNQTVITPDIKGLVQDVVDRPGWVANNDMVFGLQRPYGSKRRVFYSYDGTNDASKRPKLVVTYENGGAGLGNVEQQVGVRFNRVGIPQGATINQAYIEFTAAAAGSGSPELQIQGELTDDADKFTTTDGDISTRTTTAASVNWDPAAWTAGTTYQTPELKTVVQELVGQTDWCGNNSMAFVIDRRLGGATGTRTAQSYEGSASDAPRLYVDWTYDSENPPAGTSGCVNQVLQAQISHEHDDAEEIKSNGDMQLSGRSLDMNTNEYIGLRFQDIPVAKDADIISAWLTLEARSDDSQATTLTIKGQSAANPGKFLSNDDDISDRSTLGTTVTWTPDEWESNNSYSSPELEPVIQAIVNQSGWTSGNDLVLIIEATAGQRRAKSFKEDQLKAATLHYIVKSGGVVGKTVRNHLVDIIDTLNHNGYTPIVDVLYEAAAYYRGDAVHWGLTRGAKPGVKIDGATFGSQRYTRVSHPASYTGGTVVRDAGCTDADLNSTDCKNEHITGGPSYISPVQEWCQDNYIIFLTDGEANHNSSDGSGGYDTSSSDSWYPEPGSLIQSMIGGSCDTSGVHSSEKCGRDLVEFLHSEDQLSDSAMGWSTPSERAQTVETYTIGFSLGSGSRAETFMQDLATLGDGQYYPVSDAASLTSVFNTILGDILSRSSSFAAPAVSVNAFNKLYHDTDVYFSMFLPRRTVGWPGNLKKFYLCQGDVGDTCTLGEIMDSQGNHAIGGDNKFNSTARSFWSSSADGSEVQKGGAGDEIPAYPDRNIYTYTGGSAPSNTSLHTNDYRITHWDESDPVDDDLRIDLEGAGLSNDDYAELIKWILGMDTEDEDGDGSTTDSRWAFSDTLHSRPVVATYGKVPNTNPPEPIKKVFVATNGAGLRMINSENGIEEWQFIPNALLSEMRSLKANAEGDHTYGIDGHITKSIKDVNGDGIIDPNNGDHVWIFFGMRRGGKNYYALDVTPTSILSSKTATGGVRPKLKWRIEGGSGNFQYLDQTWSSPMPTTVKWDNGSNVVDKDVLIFSGGYNDSQDGKFGPSGSGNAIYVVDADTGARLWWAGPANSGADLELTAMTYPIPATPALIESHGTGYVDRLYVGDTGGQVWRIYFGDYLGDTTNQQGKRLATLSTQTADESAGADTRKFFYRPDVVKVYDHTFSSVAKYDLVTLTSGDRANPTEATVHNRAYALRDSAIAGPLPNDWEPLDHDDLYDATSNAIQNSDGTYDSAEVASLKSSKGWYMDLNSFPTVNWQGEKGLARSLVIAGKLLFTTYTPGANAAEDLCKSPVEGSGDVFAVNVLNAAAAYATWDGNESNYTRNDRTFGTSMVGIPSEPVPIITRNGATIIVGSSSGALETGIMEDTGLDLKPFWNQSPTPSPSQEGN